VLQGFAVAAWGDRSGLGFLRVGRVWRSKNPGVRAIKDVLPQPRQIAKTPPAAGAGPV